MSSVICEYRLQARRPGNYFALGVAMSASYLAWTLSMPKTIWVLIVIYLGLVLWRLAVNPVTGFRLRDDRIETIENGRLRVVPLAQVESFRLSLERFAPALCLVTLEGGEVIGVRCGGAARARTLAKGLRMRGIPDA
ncbi:MAG: hypothetical protein ACKVPY_04355 [Paracoccaceae bacterium]